MYLEAPPGAEVELNEVPLLWLIGYELTGALDPFIIISKFLKLLWIINLIDILTPSTLLLIEI